VARLLVLFSRVLTLLPRQLHAFVLDQRGFGDSEGPDGGYRIDDFAADVVAFLDAVSIERATIVGHSFGSFVARQVAITYPERVARMVLIDTGVSAATPVVREVQAALLDLQDPVPLEFARDFQASTAYAPLPELFFERIVAESVKLPARLWREVLDELLAYDDAGKLSRIRAPTLLMWGEHDALFPRDDQDRLVTAIQGAKLWIYQETGHCPNWECPERVAADLQAFLQQS
jgi:pimeloyl-ACP methyl ester carboxylesterase